MNEIEERLINFRCPRWNELPDVELYMDQLVGYAERHLEPLNVGQEGRLITSSMINNYVKMKLVPAPIKKKIRSASGFAAPGHLFSEAGFFDL